MKTETAAPQSCTLPSTAERIRSLTPEDKERLEAICAFLARCLGDSPDSAAIVVMQDKHGVSFAIMNTQLQDAHDMMSEANQLFHEVCVGQVPAKEMMN